MAPNFDSTLDPGLENLLEKRKVAIVAGTGGVGKTTISASIAMQAALAGKRALVITIDPAKRLATAMGIPEISDQATDLTDRLKKSMAEHHPKVEVSGTLSAIIPDHRKTFEGLIDELAADVPNGGQLAHQVKSNPLFQFLAKEFSGANEYIAIQKLNSVYKTGQYDFIVLDTPPNRNMLDFLDAPKVLAPLFEDKLIGWFIKPTNRVFSMGMNKALSTLENLTGSGFFANLLDFFKALFEVRTGFSRTLDEVKNLIRSPQIGFLMVTGPHPETKDDFNQLALTVDRFGFHLDGLIVNRCLSEIPAGSVPSYTPELERGLAILTEAQKREKIMFEEIAPLIQNQSQLWVKRLPELIRDIYCMEDLFYLSQTLAHQGATSSVTPDA